MKRILFTLVCLFSLAACGQAAVSPTATVTPVPTNTPQPTDPSQPGATLTSPELLVSKHWQIINQFQVAGDITLLGFLNPSLGIGVGLESLVLYSNDNAHTWPNAQNQSNCLFGLEIVNENVAWACGNVGNVRLSTDGGATWQIVNNFGDHTLAYCHHLSFLDATTGWAATTTKLGMTTDGAQTWHPVTLPQGIGEIEAIFLRTANEGYVLDASGRIYITADGGETWKTSALPSGNHGNISIVTKMVPSAAIRFSDAENGMAVYQTHDFAMDWHLWVAYTSSGGISWQVEQLPTNPQAAWPLYLSRDGQFLTLMVTYPISPVNDVTLFQYNP